MNINRVINNMAKAVMNGTYDGLGKEGEKYMYNVQNKYYNTAKVKVGGTTYDSKFEAAYGQELELRKKAGDIKDFFTHEKIELVSNGYRICNYYVDFVVIHNDESTEYVETKGYVTEVFKMKWKIFESMYGDTPDVKLTLVFQGKTWDPKMRKVK